MIDALQKSDPNLPSHDFVYRTLRTRIMHGELGPGTPLTLRGVGSEFDVSMTPAREALRRLVAEGALSLTASGRVMTPVLANERIEELAAVRSLLEPEIASRALPRVHLALIDRLVAINSLLSEAVAKGDAIGYVRSNLEFHRTLYLRAQAPAMLALVETLWLQLGPTMPTIYNRIRKNQPPRHHQTILAALKAGDEPGLRLAVRTDVSQGLRHIIE